MTGSAGHDGRLACALAWASASVGRQVAVITLLAALILIPGLATLPVTDRDEARFAQASKQMLETGDLIDIRFQDKPRWKKPVGIYWLQAGSASLFGGSASLFGGTGAPIWAYRLPSAIAAWLTALLTLWAARPLIGQRDALVAGVISLTSLLLVAEGHIAKTDAALAASATAALGALAHLFLGNGGRWTALVFWLAIAAAILLKGPVVPLIAVFAIAGLWWHRETRPRLARLRALPGLALVAILVAPWLIAIWQVSDGAFFSESLGRDMGAKLTSGQEKHWGPPGLYLGLVWLTLWPWAALLPAAVAWLWPRRREAWLVLIVAWVVPFWLVLEAVPTKLPHYVLPLYPALAIALATFAVAPERAPRWARRLGAALLVVPGVLIAAAVIALPLATRLAPEMSDDIPAIGHITPSVPAILLALVAVGASLAGMRAALRDRRLAQTGAAIIAALAVYPAILSFALPSASQAFPSPRLAALIQQHRPCASGPAFSIGYHEPSLVFLTETGIRMADPEGAVTALANDPGALVLIEDRWQEILGALPPHVVRASVTYFNYNRGKLATARLVTQDHPRWSPCLN